MPLKSLLTVVVLALPSLAQAPLPELLTEPINGGSIFHVRNTSAQPLTAYLIELVNYPGSSYSLYQDEITAEPLAPGAARRIQVVNMTVGAVPDYVKLQAAIYADGTSAGIPEKVTQMLERRRAILETTRELIRRCEKAEAAKAALIDELKQWSATLQPAGKGNRFSQKAVNDTAARGLINDILARLEAHPVEETLVSLRTAEHALAASKPTIQ